MNEIRIVLVASGGGTDAKAVMEADRDGQLLAACEIVGLISTVRDADCLQQAAALQFDGHTIARKGQSLLEFQAGITSWLRGNDIRLMFLLGCIHPMPVVHGVDTYNIHPADPLLHGGKGMYGLAPHIHVLAAILDKLKRGQTSPEEIFYTFPTVHEVTDEYDQGRILLQAAVEIPSLLIEQAKTDIEAAAKKLQELVLPNEHLILPAAVNLAVQRILSGV